MSYYLKHLDYALYDQQKGMNGMADVFESLAEEFRAMAADGIELVEEGQGHAVLGTGRKSVAKKWHFDVFAPVG